MTDPLDAITPDEHQPLPPFGGFAPELLGALGAPTPGDEVKQRPIFNKEKQKVGELDYVDARFVMERLDDVVGPGRWQDSYRETPGGIVCRLGILIADVGWVYKEDVGTESSIEAVKGSYSDAFKRAAVKWGIARDLYDSREEQQAKPAHTNGAARTSAAPARSSGAPRPQPIDVDATDSPWVCPEHGAVVAWPAGVSASSGRPYDAFYACPKGRDCEHRAPRGLKVRPEHLSPPAADDLPF